MINRVLEKSECQDFIKRCYDGDRELLNSYHPWAGCGLDACTFKTAADLQDSDIIGIEQDGTPVGFVATSTDGLSTFYCRNSDYLEPVAAVLDVGNCKSIKIFGRDVRAKEYLEKLGYSPYDFKFTPEGVDEFYIRSK